MFSLSYPFNLYILSTNFTSPTKLNAEKIWIVQECMLNYRMASNVTAELMINSSHVEKESRRESLKAPVLKFSCCWCKYSNIRSVTKERGVKHVERKKKIQKVFH